MKQRIEYIDVCRGLLMTLVVLGHSIGNAEDGVNKVLLSFHMPAFFFLSGMCFRPKSVGYKTVEVLSKKCGGLVWPYITFSILGVCLYWLLLAGTTKDCGATLLQTIIGIAWYDDVYGILVTPGFWFVYDLIWITLIHILTKCVNKGVKLGASILLSALIYTCLYYFYFSTELLRISIGYAFFLLGDSYEVLVNSKMKPLKKMGGGKYPPMFVCPFDCYGCCSVKQ